MAWKYSDRKKGKPVSEHEKSTEYEICKNCGELIPFGSRCPNCGLTHEEFEHRWDKYKRE